MPAVQATPKPKPTHVPPQILRVDLSKSDIGAGDYVTGEVVTSDNVAGVTALIIGQTIDLTRTRAGHFPIYFTVPAPVPFFFKGPQTVEFVARNSTGERTTKTINFHVH